MMMPSIFGENLFDNWMDFPFEDEFFGKKNPLYGKHEKNLMKTDVRETKDGYEVDVDLPGFKKDNISAQLQDCLLYTSMEGFFLCNGNETQEIMKSSGEHDFCFRRFIGMFCTRKRGISHLCRL